MRNVEGFNFINDPISFVQYDEDDDGMMGNYTEPEIETTQDGFVSLQQERIMFPDTHL